MSGRRRATLVPALFPFLAVLVCTLGTLILMLALVSQKADQAAQKTAQAVAGPDPEKLVAEQQWRRQQLTSIRDQQTAELETRRSELAHVEDHLRRLRSQLQQLNAETIAAAHPSEDPADRQAQLDALREQIEQEDQRVAELRQQAPGVRPRVVIVPHQGPNGTARRPVYVECTAEGIFLRPENAHIDVVQLAGPLGPGNPLDAALRAVRSYWQQHDPEAPPPYPLLVIRPDGIESYAVARAAMTDWDDQFGYELVAADVELEFPKPQTELRQQIDLAIRQAVLRQHARIAGMPRRYRSASDLPVRSAAERAREAAARGGYATGGGGSDGGGSDGERNDQGERSAGAASTGAASTEAGRIGAASTEAGWSGDGWSGDGSTGPTATALARPADPYGAGSGSAARAFDESLRHTAAASVAGGPSQGLSIGQPSVDDPFGGRGQAAGAGLAAASGRESSGRESSGRSAQTATGSGGPQSSGGAQPGESQSASATAGGGDRPTQGSPSGSQASTATTPPTLRRGGRDWALPETMAGGRGAAIVRQIHVTCRTDAFVVHGEERQGASQEFAFRDGMIDRAAMQLAAAAQQRVQSWGLALPGGRWQPVLTVDVAEGAETRYRQLRTLLNGSGLTLERR